VDVAMKVANIDEVVSQLGSAPQDYFFQFVNTIIEREASEKWIDRSGEPFKQLLSVPEHHQLLSMVANEMWLASSDSLKADVLDVVTDLFCDLGRKGPMVARQVKERLKHHSLLVTSDASRNTLAFDHEDFRKFFLGDAVGRLLQTADPADLRQFLQVAALPAETCEAAVHFLHRNESPVEGALQTLRRLAESETPTSFVRENAGLLAICLLDLWTQRPLELVQMVFPTDVLKGRRVHGVHFARCYFQPTSLADSVLENCTFEACRFERLELTKSTEVQNTRLVGCEVTTLIRVEQDDYLFDPAAIESALHSHGFLISGIQQPSVTHEPDEETRVLERALRVFLRANHINESVFRQRLGVKASTFFSTVLPALERAEVVQEIPYLGKGQQRRFRLAAPMQSIQEALEQSHGRFAEFLARFEQG